MRGDKGQVFFFAVLKSHQSLLCFQEVGLRIDNMINSATRPPQPATSGEIIIACGRRLRHEYPRGPWTTIPGKANKTSTFLPNNLSTNGVLPANPTHKGKGRLASTPVFMAFMVKQPPTSLFQQSLICVNPRHICGQ